MKLSRWLGVLLSVALLAGCQTQVTPGSDAAQPRPSIPPEGAQRYFFDLPHAWGGQVRCGAQDCLLAAVEHEENVVALHRLKAGKTQLLDRHKVAYHPDSAIWLADDLIAAAVETTASIDVFRVVADRMTRIAQLPVGFGPRDVVLARAEGGRYLLLATPYKGRQVAWIDWQVQTNTAEVKNSEWCEAPWHPTRVTHVPGAEGGGIAAACLDGKKVVAVSEANLLAPPKILASFDAIARQARPTPSGKWLYVALETGGRNARIHMETGELQWVSAAPTGAVSVAPLSDDLVIWGDDHRLTLQRLDAQGLVLETRFMRTSGFSTSLQLVDVDGDASLDLVVLNSSDKRSEILFGPLWEQAERNPD